MIALLYFILNILISPFKSKGRLEAENAALRHQLIILRRKLRGRVRLTNSDRWLFIQLYRWFPAVLNAITIIQPETLVRWHRAGFRYYWRWKSRSLGERPQIGTDLRALIRRMSIENPLWGAPHLIGRSEADRCDRIVPNADLAVAVQSLGRAGRVSGARSSLVYAVSDFRDRGLHPRRHDVMAVPREACQGWRH